MADYFVGQTNLRIELETNVTLTGSTLAIKYMKPSGGTAVSEAATINGSDPSKMYWDADAATDLAEHGTYIFWAHVTFADATIGIGTAVAQVIKYQGQL